MTELTALHNIKNKTSVSGGIAGVGLGTILIALAPKISSDGNTVQFLQLIAPTISIVGAYVTKIFISYIRTYYVVWAATKMEQKIDSFLSNPELSPDHVQNLKIKREELQIKQLNAMESGLMNVEDGAVNIINKSPKRTSKKSTGSD
jgi:hypothetical protein